MTTSSPLFTLSLDQEPLHLEFCFLSGWSLPGSIWTKLAQQIHRKLSLASPLASIQMNFECSRGEPPIYLTSKFQSRAKKSLQHKRILFTHSFSTEQVLLWLAEEQAPQPDAWISFHGFPSLGPSHSRWIDPMYQELQSSIHEAKACLERFWDSIDLPESLRPQDPYLFLLEHKEHLAHSLTLMKRPLEQVSIPSSEASPHFAFASSHDPIVSLELTRKLLPQSLHVLEESHSHLAMLTHADYCAEYCVNFLMDLFSPSLSHPSALTA